MGQFFIPKLAQFCGEIRIRAGDFGNLRRIVLLDHALDGNGAGVGRLFAQQGGSRAQGKTRQTPEGGHKCGAHLVAAQKAVEASQVHRLMAFHFRELPDNVLLAGSRAQHSLLAPIDVDCGELARVIDPEHFGQPCLGCTAPRAGGNGLFRHENDLRLEAAIRLSTVSFREIKTW